MSKLGDQADDLLAAQRAQDQEERDTTKWSPEPGDRLNGIVLAGDYLTTRFGPTVRMIVRNIGTEESGGVEPDKSALVWLGAVGLQRAIRKQQPKIGTEIIIQFEGKEEQDSGNEMNIYTVVSEESDPDHWEKVFEKLDAATEGRSSARGNRRRGAPGDAGDGGEQGYF